MQEVIISSVPVQSRKVQSSVLLACLRQNTRSYYMPNWRSMFMKCLHSARPMGSVIPRVDRCLWSTSLVMYFVITSEVFKVPATFLIATMPEVTSSWINKNRSWTCLVFLEVPKRVAIDLPAVLSVWSLMLTFCAVCDSKRSERINRLSLTPRPIAYSSASPDEVATVCCVLLCEVIRVPRKYNAIPEVLHRVATQPAQSESTKQSMSNEVCLECGITSGRSCKTAGFVPARYLRSVFIFTKWSLVGATSPRESSLVANWMSGRMLLSHRSCPTIRRYNLCSSFERSSSDSINLRSESTPGVAAGLQFVMSSCSSILSMYEVGIDISIESSRRVMQRPKKLMLLPDSRTPSCLKHNCFWSSANRYSQDPFGPNRSKSST